MKRCFYLLLVLAVISFTACGNKSGASSETADSSNVDSVKVDSVEKTTFSVDDDKAFVENFYTNVVLSWGEPGGDEKALEEALLKAITPEIAKKKLSLNMATTKSICCALEQKMDQKTSQRYCPLNQKVTVGMRLNIQTWGLYALLAFILQVT